MNPNGVAVALSVVVRSVRWKCGQSMFVHCKCLTQLESLKLSPKSFTMLVVTVLDQQCASYLLSTSSICPANDREAVVRRGGSKKNTSPLKLAGRYLTFWQDREFRSRDLRSLFAQGLLCNSLRHSKTHDAFSLGGNGVWNLMWAYWKWYTI